MLETVRPGLFMFLDIPGEPVRIWTGAKPYTLPPDDIDTEGGVYIPLGLENLPVIDALLNGQAGEYTFVLSGLPADAAQYVDDVESVSGSLVRLGEIRFDAAWQPIDGVEWFATYEAETVGFGDVNTDDSGAQGRDLRVSLTVSSATTDRRMAPNIHWSEIEARETQPGDRAFDYVNRYTTGSRRQYPA